MLLGVLALLWGSSYPLIKIALTSLPPTSLMALRVTIASVILLGVLSVRGESLPRDAASWQSLFIQSLLNSSVPWLVLAWGQQFVPSGLAGVLNSTSPLFVVLISAVVISASPLSRTKIAGAVIGFVGVVLVIGVDALRGIGQNVIAQCAILLSALLYALAAMRGKPLAHMRPLTIATGTTVLAAAVLVPLAFIVDDPMSIRPTAQSLAAVLSLAIMSTCVALLIYFRLMQTLGAAGVASQAYLRAGVSMAVGTLVLGERLPPTIWVGVAAALIGVVLINRPERR